MEQTKTDTSKTQILIEGERRRGRERERERVSTIESQREKRGDLNKARASEEVRMEIVCRSELSCSDFEDARGRERGGHGDSF